MFDHLGPIPKVKNRRRLINYRLYGSALLFGIVLLLVSWSVNSGSKSIAQQDGLPTVTISDLSLDQSIVRNSNRIPVFNFLVTTSAQGVSLGKLKLYTGGLYTPELFQNLKLYHRDVQLGQLSSIDQDGNVTFDLAGYVLPAGDNELSLFLTSTKDLALNDILRFSLEEPASLLMYYGQQAILGHGQWPISGGITVIVDKGSLSSYNNLPKGEFLSPSESASILADFSLASQAEAADLEFLQISYNTDNDIAGRDFFLKVDGEIVARALAKNGLIDFSFKPRLAIPVNQSIKLNLAGALPTGDCTFGLNQARAIGYVSGQDLELAKTMNLARVLSQDYFLEFTNLSVDQNLTQGWNAVANIQAISRGVDTLDIQRLTWQINTSNVKVKAAKIMLDDQVYPADLVLKEDRIIAKAGWSKPMVVSKRGTSIKLLLDLDSLSPNSLVQTILLTDHIATISDQLDSNLLWSGGDDMRNGYLLPGLPNMPQILAN